jgi:hypothetical protein
LERGCVQSTSRSKLEGSAASGILRQAGFAKPLRLVYDTAALRGQCQDAPTLMDSRLVPPAFQALFSCGFRLRQLQRDKRVFRGSPLHVFRKYDRRPPYICSNS